MRLPPVQRRLQYWARRPSCCRVSGRSHHVATSQTSAISVDWLDLRVAQVFQQSGFKAKIKKLGVLSSQYTAITVLRLLLWLDGDSPYREIVLNMEDHDQERRRHQPDTWNMQKHLIVNFIQKVRINGIKCKTPGVEFRLQIDLSSRHDSVGN